MVVGNKTDLEAERQVTKEEGEEFAKSRKLRFIETSAKDGENISEPFEIIASELARQKYVRKRCHIPHTLLVCDHRLVQVVQKK